MEEIEEGRLAWGDAGEMWGDVGRCGEMCGDVGRCGEMWRDVARCGEMAYLPSMISSSRCRLVSATALAWRPPSALRSMPTTC